MVNKQALSLPLRLYSLARTLNKCDEKSKVWKLWEYHKGKYQKRQQNPVLGCRELKFEYSTGGKVSWHNHFEEQLTDQNLERLKIKQIIWLNNYINRPRETLVQGCVQNFSMHQGLLQQKVETP